LPPGAGTSIGSAERGVARPRRRRGRVTSRFMGDAHLLISIRFEEVEEIATSHGRSECLKSKSERTEPDFPTEVTEGSPRHRAEKEEEEAEYAARWASGLPVFGSLAGVPDPPPGEGRPNTESPDSCRSAYSALFSLLSVLSVGNSGSVPSVLSPPSDLH
jgi:hypothetical protein